MEAGAGWGAVCGGFQRTVWTKDQLGIKMVEGVGGVPGRECESVAL